MKEVEIGYCFGDRFNSVLERANHIKKAGDFVNEKYGGEFVYAGFSSEGVAINVYIKAEKNMLEGLFIDYISYEINNGNLSDFIREGINRSRLEAFSCGRNSVYIKSPSFIPTNELLNRQGLKLKRKFFPKLTSPFAKIIPT